ncbi:MAG TPA: hypothetical protein VHU81_00925 [Thermoanaerobaculia bacterium]|nr:hypothetical protein [Thermoanaerobaculia bacterium]
MLRLGTPLASPLPWRRAVVAWFLGCVLLLGSVAPHAPAEEHTDSLQAFEIDGAAQHPGDPAHFEGSRPETHPACQACLLHLQGSSLLTAPAPLPGLQPGAAVAVRPEPSPSAAFQILRPARGPPASPSSL